MPHITKRKGSESAYCSASFRPKMRQLAGILLLLFQSRAGLAEDYFDPAAVELSSPEQKMADLHYFEKQGGQMPGIYRVTLVLNGHEVDSREITFVEEEQALQPVFTPHDLAALGVNVGALAALARLPEDWPLTRLADYIPQAKSRFDFSQQRLELSIPQAAMDIQSRDFVPPELWDDGIPAAFVNYSLAGAYSRRESGEYTSNYLSLRNGLNVGAWRLRNYSSFSHNAGSHWRSQSTWLMRDIRSLKSQLRVGDAYTPGDVFDSVPFRGVQLTSSDSMLPDSQRGYAPVIRGVAHSFAKVSVAQHGYVIYETWVAAGPFVINDLFPTSQSGDLEVTVTESDGSRRTFTQPWSAVPFMLREGRLKYSVNIGRYHNSTGDMQTPEFIDTTFFYGLPAGTTLYGGTQLANNYQSFALGVGHGFGKPGSLGVDLTLAKTRLPDGNLVKGKAWRVQYQKDFAATGTSFSMASYRYSTRDFYEFNEVNQSTRQDLWLNNRRSRSQLTLTQGLDHLGSISVSAWMQDYWRTPGQDKTIHVGWYSSWQGISWGLGYYYTDSATERNPERTLSFNINVPLSKWLPDSSVSYFYNHNNRGMTTQQVSLYGALLENNRLNYSIQQGYASSDRTSSTSLALQYNGSYGDASVGFDHSPGSNNTTWGLSGGVLATQYGITLSQPLGDTVALLRAPGAANVEVEGTNNIHTDGRGYAVMPSLTPYRKNTLTLNTESMGDDTDVEISGQTVIPASGAVVLADYKTHIGYRVLFSVHYRGVPVPFGAVVELTTPDNVDSSHEGIAAEYGQVYLSGVPAQGTLRARWNEDGVTYQCLADFTLGENLPVTDIKTLIVECR